MQNFSLLREAGKSGKPILLKRGMYSTLEEWLNCAEYILAEGNEPGHPLRARHQDLRDLHAQHPRPLHRCPRPKPRATSHHRRSLARDGHPFDDRAHEHLAAIAAGSRRPRDRGPHRSPHGRPLATRTSSSPLSRVRAPHAKRSSSCRSFMAETGERGGLEAAEDSGRQGQGHRRLHGRGGLKSHGEGRRTQGREVAARLREPRRGRRGHRPQADGHRHRSRRYAGSTAPSFRPAPS